MTKLMKNLGTTLLCIVISGIFIALSMPPYDHWWLALVALTPLLYISHRQSPIIAFGAGLLAIVVTGGILGGRIYDTAYAANIFASFGSLALSVGMALCLVTMGRNARTSSWILLAASAGVFGEWIGAHLFPVSLAMSLHTNPVALKLSSFTGYWGVTFLMWYVSACLTATLMRKPQVIKPILVGLLLVLLLIPATFFSKLPARNYIKIAAIQGMDPTTLREQTVKLRGRASIAVWPENGLEPGDRDLQAAAIQSGMYIAANFAEHPNVGKPFNTSYYIAPNGKVLGKCRKQHLFGAEVFVYAKPRRSTVPITQDSNLKVAVPTCYDTMFTDTIRDYVRNGAQLILVTNNDPEARNHLFGRMHAAMTAFRAAENAVPLAITDSISVSTIFDSNGRVLAQTKPGSQGVIHASVTPGASRTLYNRTGDILPLLCLAYMLILTIRAWKDKSKADADRERKNLKAMYEEALSDK